MEQAYVSYRKEDEEKVIQILNKSSLLDKFKLFRLEVDNFRNKIKESDFVVFFLTNVYLRTKRFSNELKHARALQKLIIFVFIGKIDSFSFSQQSIELLNKCELNDFSNIFIEDSTQPECYIRLEAFIFRAFKMKRTNNEAIDFDLEFISYELINSNCIDYISKPNVNFISVNELAVKKPNGILVIINFEIDKILCEITTGMQRDYTFCLIGHNEQLLISGTLINSDIPKINLYEKSGTLLNTIQPDFLFNKIISLGYSITSNTVFATFKKNYHGYNVVRFDENFKTALIKPIKFSTIIYNEYLYTYDKDECFIHDLYLNYLTSIKINVKIDSLLVDPKQENRLIIKSYKSIFFLNTDSFEIICFLNFKLDFGAIINEKLILGHKQSQSYKAYSFYKIVFKKPASNSDEMYFCQFNPFKVHLQSKSFLLPCGNLACAECIYNNYNIYTRSLKCNYETCKQMHKLPQQIDFHKVETNIDELTRELINDENYVLSKLGIFKKFYLIFILIYFLFIIDVNSSLDAFENKFEYLESILSIRIESVKSQVDNLSGILMEKIKQYEKGLAKSKNLEATYKLIKTLEIRKLNIGILCCRVSRRLLLPTITSQL